MIRRRFSWLALVGALTLAAGSSGQADGARRMTFSGQIDDHTIANAGAWEIHGTWSLHTEGRSGKADFTAALNMERSDYWMLTTGGDPNLIAVRNPHTHHISVTDGVVTELPNGGFRVSGPAILTGNGGIPGFGTDSSIQIDITGGSLVALSNINVTFMGNAANHFGSLPIAGVVRKWK